MEEPKENIHKKKRLPLVIVTVISIVILLTIFFWWLFYGRFHKTTSDAYVHGNAVRLTSQISGIVNSINTDDTMLVEEGQVLVELDDTDYQIAFQKAQSAMGETIRQVTQMFENVYSLAALYEEKQSIMIQKEIFYLDRKEVVKTGAISEEEFVRYEAEYYAAKSIVEKTRFDLVQAYSQVKDTTVKTHPLVEKAKEQVLETYVNLNRCKLQSPVRGIVAQRNVQVGQQVSPGLPLLALVPLEDMWVNANFRETDLAKIRIGQPVILKADTYGDDIEYHGVVLGLGGGTGAVFSPLPPQNATGNWIKIVQRLPIRVSLSREQLLRYPLRLGLSMHADIDVSDKSGSRIPEHIYEKPIYHTKIYRDQSIGIEEIFIEVFNKNLTYEPTLTSEVRHLATHGCYKR